MQEFRIFQQDLAKSLAEVFYWFGSKFQQASVWLNGAAAELESFSKEI